MTEQSTSQSITPVDASQLVLVLTGAALSIAGALAPWGDISLSIPSTSMGMPGMPSMSISTSQKLGLIMSSTTISFMGQSSTTNSECSASATNCAGGSLLLIGFILGFIHFAVLLYSFCKSAKISKVVHLTLSVIAFLATLIGTIIGGVGSTGTTLVDMIAALKALGVSAALGAGFGLAIAATIIQSFALGLAVYKGCSVHVPVESPSMKVRAPGGV